MDAEMSRRRPLAMAAPLLAAGASMIAGCGGATERSESRAGVTIDIDLVRGHAWTAVGAQVDDGTICGSGRHWGVEPRDVDEATPLSLREFARRQDVALATDGAVVEFTMLTELMCHDGSGTITVIERPAATDDTGSDARTASDSTEVAWFVVSGSGAYTDLVGEGTALLLSSGPPGSPDDPPEGTPSILRWTGNLQHASPDATR
jgi:hypothetical protein